MGKSDRQLKIIELITDNVISTQDDLTERLVNEGYNATQATISRDLQELRVVKTLLPDGTYKYTATKTPEFNVSDKIQNIFSQSLLSVDCAQNIVVLKTLSGAAQAAGYALDSFVWDEIVGSIAGDDTVMIVVRNEKSAKQLSQKLSKFIK